MIGRDPSCEVVIDAEGVELHHASLMLEGTKIQVEDLTGGHKTFVNGYDISGRVEVECPATVQMGPAVLRVKVVEAAPDAHKAESGRTIFTMCASPGGAQAEAAEPTEEMLLGMGPRSASVQVRYALGKEIARGGMGRIYTGEDPQLKRVVAVKVQRPKVLSAIALDLFVLRLLTPLQVGVLLGSAHGSSRPPFIEPRHGSG